MVCLNTLFSDSINQNQTQCAIKLSQLAWTLGLSHPLLLTLYFGDILHRSRAAAVNLNNWVRAIKDADGDLAIASVYPLAIQARIERMRVAEPAGHNRVFARKDGDCARFAARDFVAVMKGESSAPCLPPLSLSTPLFCQSLCRKHAPVCHLLLIPCLSHSIGRLG